MKQAAACSMANREKYAHVCLYEQRRAGRSENSFHASLLGARHSFWNQNFDKQEYGEDTTVLVGSRYNFFN